MGSATTTTTASWTPPPIITGFSNSIEEEESRVLLSWDTSTLSDADFDYYQIYRRVMGDTVWTSLAKITIKSTAQYYDLEAGQAVNYEYMITQFKAITGDVSLESGDSDITTAQLTTDAWFVIINEQAIQHALEMNVTTETHTAMIQQEVFEPLALKRKRVVRGNVLGDEGSFTARVDQSLVSYYRTHIEHIKVNPGPHILKSPFGDVWLVEFDAPSFAYVPAGHLDVTIGWVEVSS